MMEKIFNTGIGLAFVLMFFVILFDSCRFPNEPVEDEGYVYRYFIFSRPSEWDSVIGWWKWTDTQVLICVNGRFINTSDKDYRAFPRLKLRYKDSGEIYRVFDGGLGYTSTEDWSQYIPVEDRFQPLSVVFDTIKANSELRIKVLTGFFYVPKDTLVMELVFVINGKERIKSPLGKIGQIGENFYSFEN
jgi:hypothetical protein